MQNTIDITDTAANIRELQTLLRAISFYDPQIPHITSDGIYGPETEDAVRAFQKCHNIPCTGQVNLETWNALTHAYTSSAALFQPGASICPLFNPAILTKEPLNCTFVEMVQVLLRGIAGVCTFHPPVKVTGVYSEETAAAIAVLQRFCGLQPSGKIDLTTWNSLSMIYDLEIKKLQSNPPTTPPANPSDTNTPTTAT